MELDAKKERVQKDGRMCLKRAKAHLKKNSKTWDENKLLMMGQIKGQAKHAIAEAYGQFRSLVSNILVSVPQPYFEAKKEEQRVIAQCLSDAVYYDFQIGKLREKLVKALWQTFPYGYGPIGEQVESEFIRNEKGEVTGIESQRFYWKNIPPRDVLFDPDGFCIDLSDHRFVFVAHYKTIEEIRGAEKYEKGNPYFNLEDIDKLPRANETSRGKDDISSRLWQAQSYPGTEDDQPAYHQIKLWRMYDRATDMISEFTDADERLIRHESWPVKIKIEGIAQFPFKILAMNPETDEFYPIPECDLIRPQLANLVKLNDQLMTDLTGKIRKYIGLSPYIDDKKLGKLIDSKRPDSFMVTHNSDVLMQQANLPKIDSAADALHKLPDIMVDPQVVPGMQEIRNQIQNIMAYGSANRGGMPAIRSAKEAARVADATQRALIGRQTSIEEFTADLAIYHALLLKEAGNDNEERYYRITDKVAGFTLWHSYSPSQIPDEKDIFWDVYVGTSTPKTLDSKRAQFLQEFQVLMPWIEKMKLSPLPLLYRYGEIFQVKYIDTLFKNPKGAAMELLAALVRAGQLGAQAPPDLLLKPAMAAVDSLLGPDEKQLVVQAVQGQAAPGGGGGGGAHGQVGSPDPFKAAGNPEGGVTVS